jgi:hypothetical protein
MNNTHLEISGRKLAWILTALATFLAIQSIVLRALQYWTGVHNTYWLYQYGELVNINREANIPTWFSTALLLAAAALLLVIALSRRATKDPFAGWIGLAVIFTYISMDEAGTIHEKLTPILQEQLNLSGFFYFGWVLVGIPVALVVGLVYLPFVRRLPAHVRRWFVVAGLLYLGGALVVESISAKIWYLGSGTSLRFSAVGTVEEWMEMVGVIALIYGLLEYLRTEVGVMQFAVHKPGQETEAVREAFAAVAGGATSGRDQRQVEAHRSTQV